MTIGILGGGLTGLSIAAHLEQDFEVLEKNDRCGGLCRSEELGGFTFDRGGHILFSRDEGLLREMVSLLGKNVLRRYRTDRIFYKGRTLRYPFESDLAALPARDTLACLYHFIRRGGCPTEGANLREWLYANYGQGIADRYLIPYNEKIWKVDPADLETRWAEERLPGLSLGGVIRSSLGIRKGRAPGLPYHYPETGGIEALIRALEEGLDTVRRGTPAKRVLREGSSWIVSDGKGQRRYDRIVSTLPVPELLGLLEGIPGEVAEASRRLRYNSLITVMVGFRGDCPLDAQALYFSRGDFLFHRVCFPNRFSVRNTPAGAESILAEITARRVDESWRLPDDRLIRHVIDSLEGEGIVKVRERIQAAVVRDPYAYIVQDHHCRGSRSLINEYMKKIGIIPCGRFAEWEYLNMDACFARGREIASELNRGEPLP